MKRLAEWFFNLPWGVIMVVMIVLIVFGGLGLGIFHATKSFRDECHNAGGHVIDVRGDSICVGHDERVIHL